MNSLVARWAEFSSRYRFATFLIGILLLAAMSPGLSRIRANFTHTAYFWEDDPVRQQFEAFTSAFGSDEVIAIGIYSPDGIFDAASAEKVQAVTDELWRVPDIIRVDSLSNLKLVTATEGEFTVEDVFPTDAELTPDFLAARRTAVMNLPGAVGSVVSESGTTTVAAAYLKPVPDGELRDVDAAAAAIDALVARHADDDHVFHPVGGPYAAGIFKRMAEQDAPRIRLIAFGAASLVLLILFRRLGGLVIPMLLVISSIFATLCAAGWIGIEITSLSAGIVQLMLAVALTISIHVVSRFYHHIYAGLDRQESIRHSVAENLIPTFLTAATTAMAFFACYTADLKIVGGFGILGGAGTLLAWLLTFLLTPFLLRWFPMIQPKTTTATTSRRRDRARWFVGVLRRSERVILPAFALFALLGVLASTQVRVGTNPLTSFREDNPTRQSAEFLIDELGLLTFELVLDSGEPNGVTDPEFLKSVEELQDWIAARPGVTSVASVVDIIKSVNKALHADDPDEYRLPEDQRAIAQQLFLYTMGLPPGVSLTDRVTVDNQALRVSVSSRVIESPDHVALVRATEERAAELGMDFYTTGLHDLYQKSSIPLVRNVLRSTLTAILGVAILLAVTLRSVRVVSLAMVVNIIPLFTASLAFWLLDHHLDPGSVMSFSIALGVAVDDTVHILVHYVEHRRAGHSSAESLEHVLADVAPALFTTTAILMSAALVFLLSGFLPAFWFGLMLASIMAAALVTDLTLLPVLLLRFDAPA